MLVGIKRVRCLLSAAVQACRLGGFVGVWALILCLPLSSCGHGDDAADVRTTTLEANIQAVDDSLEVNSPRVLAMIRKGMAGASDSIGYYDYYLRLLRYSVSYTGTDTCALDWKSPERFLLGQKPTPRVRGMLGYLYNARGVYNHIFSRNGSETRGFYHKSISYLEGSDAERNLSDVCANLGDEYVAVNDMPRAAWWYRRALYLADSLRLPPRTNASLYMGLGRIYLNLGDMKLALQSYREADRNFSKMTFDMQSYFLNCYGNYFYYSKDYRSALAVFKRLERLLLSHGRREGSDISICRINLADVYLNLGDTVRSRKYLDMSAPFFIKTGFATGIFYCNTIRIGLALRRGDVAEVRRILHGEKPYKGIDFNIANIRQRYLCDYYVRTGDYKKAYLNVVSGVERNDSLKHNIENMRASEIMMRYAQDTLTLHNKIAIQEKDADIRRTQYAFYTGVLAALLLAVLLFALYSNMRRLRSDSQMQLMRLRLQNMRSRISPHFIFNVLNNHIAGGGKADSEELMTLAKLIRAGLNMSSQEYVSLKEELDFVKYYISIERGNLGEGFFFEVDAPSDDVLEGIFTPSMFVQILVENAIKHGLKGKQGDKKLRLAISVDAAFCRISVTDNGRGFDIRKSSPTSTKTGLKVIRSTINVLNMRSKGKIRLGIRNLALPDGGVGGCEMTLTLPLTLKNQKSKTT